MTLQAKLNDIQSKLLVPKSNYNSFGNYYSRSAEDILNAVKPFLNIHKLVLVIQDELVNVGDRYYVKATAQLGDGEHEISATAYAREEEQKKGMDASQLTGSTSSYARKYALNGLFAIDDTKDADTQDNRNHITERYVNKRQITDLLTAFRNSVDIEDRSELLMAFKAAFGKKPNEVLADEYHSTLEAIKGAKV